MLHGYGTGRLGSCFLLVGVDLRGGCFVTLLDGRGAGRLGGCPLIGSDGFRRNSFIAGASTLGRK